MSTVHVSECISFRNHENYRVKRLLASKKEQKGGIFSIRGQIIFRLETRSIICSTNDTKPSRLVAVTLTLQGIHCSKSNPNFRDIT